MRFFSKWKWSSGRTDFGYRLSKFNQNDENEAPKTSPINSGRVLKHFCSAKAFEANESRNGLRFEMTRFVRPRVTAAEAEILTKTFYTKFSNDNDQKGAFVMIYPQFDVTTWRKNCSYF